MTRGDVEPVTITTTPIEMSVEHTASLQETNYLLGLEQGKLLAQRCPKCGKVYIPPRGACPVDGVPTDEEVELPDRGIVTTFCIVNVPFYGQKITPPYVCAYVLLDGADIPFLHLILDTEAVGRADGHEGRSGLEAARRVGTDAAEHRPLPSDRRTGRRVRHVQGASLMRDVAVVGFAQSPQVRRSEATTNGVEMLVPIFAEVLGGLGLTKGDIGFWCSGSSDYLAGRAFSFISAIDAIGPVPPINESHVEADAAWALYEAWIKIQTGEVDTALVYGFGKSSAGNLRRTLALQLDPYVLSPLWPDSIGIAGLQARLGIESGAWSERAMAEVAVRSRRDAETNGAAQLTGSKDVDELLAEPYLADPLRRHDCAPITDGAAVIVLAADDRARELVERPAWISGIAHRVDSASTRRSRPGRLAVHRRRRARRRHRRRRGRRALHAVHPPGAVAAQRARPR